MRTDLPLAGRSEMNTSSDAENHALSTNERARLGWMALTLTPELGPTRIAKAMARLGAAERVFEASLTELEGAGMPARAAQFVFEGRAHNAAEQEANRVADAGGYFLTREDPAFPQRLLEIYDPPAVLWIRGDASLLARPGIAVVGTRHPSPYGSGMAEMLSRDLANRRLVILSGMARGVDTAAHKGALDAGGRTVAVWGTGIDVVYPKENKKLAESIVTSGGTIVSEYPLGTFPAPQNFPIRNRILSGMSVGVLVIEAAEYSGTRITARCAMEQNRDVFAVPGNVTNKNAWGPNTLIKQGAKLTATWEDIWEDLPSHIRLELEEEMRAAGQIESKGGTAASLFNEVETAALPEQERLVLDKLQRDMSTQLDELIEALEGQLASAEIFTALFELELRGRVKQMPGKNYVRCF
jgi:DNA processing protein